MRLIQFEDRAGQRRVGVVEGAGYRCCARAQHARTGAGGDSRAAACTTRCCAEAASQARTMPGCWRREGCCRWIMTTRPIAWSAAPA